MMTCAPNTSARRERPELTFGLPRHLTDGAFGWSSLEAEPRELARPKLRAHPPQVRDTMRCFGLSFNQNVIDGCTPFTDALLRPEGLVVLARLDKTSRGTERPHRGTEFLRRIENRDRRRGAGPAPTLEAWP